MTLRAYRGVTGAEHQAHADTLRAEGFRPISISVYGDPGDPRYAAVWVQRAGAAWLAVHGVDAPGYQSFFNTWTSKGYVPVLVSAAGAASNAVFAAVFEQGIQGAWQARHSLTSGPDSNAGTFQNQNEVARAQGLSLRSAAIYGTTLDRRYAGVWHANPSFVKWHVHPSDTPASYETVSSAETQLPGFALGGYRPGFVTLSDDQLYCSSFRDDVVGEWVVRHNLTATAYEDELTRQTSEGLYPSAFRAGEPASKRATPRSSPSRTSPRRGSGRRPGARCRRSPAWTTSFRGSC